MKRQLAVNQNGKQRFSFVRSVVAELRKVAWPSREEATRLTGIVLIVTVAIAIILGVIDYGFSKFAEAVLIK